MDMKVDAHQHFWNLDRVRYPWLVPEYGPIYRTFEAPELEPLLKSAGIDQTVLVQAMDSSEDTEYMLEVASTFDWIGGVVGWVPLDRPDEAERLLTRYAAEFPKFKGVRHLIHEEKDPDWVIRPDVLEGLNVLADFGLTFDVVAVFPNHLKHIPVLAERVPKLNMVIDHLAKPPMRERGWEPWASQLAEAAACPRVFAKLSGLNTASNHGVAEEWQPYVDHALAVFGAERLMFGSDWPVANLNGDYASVWRETLNVLSARTPKEVEAILGGTAQRFYRL
ncbi:amidohydrolase family protein [Cohnella candidum]|nr:amidohydrolase family protein [Cohnella candidum]